MRSSRKVHVTAAVGLAIILFCLLLAAGPAYAAGTTSGTPIKNQAITTYQDVNSNSYTAKSNWVQVNVTSVYGVDITCSVADNQNATPNLMIYYPCTIQNISNDHATFNLTTALTSTGGTWDVALFYDANGDLQHQDTEAATTTTGDLGPDGTYKVMLGVKMQPLSPNGSSSTVTLTATGTAAASSATKSLQRTSLGQAPAVSVIKKVRNITHPGTPPGFVDNGLTAVPYDVLEYQVTVSNGGSIKATNVVLTDALDAHVNYVRDSLYAGTNIAGGNLAGNLKKTESDQGDDAVCASDPCATGIFSGNTVTFNIGTGATEVAPAKGGSLDPGATVYLYYQVKVQ